MSDSSIVRCEDGKSSDLDTRPPITDRLLACVKPIYPMPLAGFQKWNEAVKGVPVGDP